jgi:hypothetical protein
MKREDVMSRNTTTQPEDAETYNTRLAIQLLIIICLGALASFSLAPYFIVPITQNPPVGNQYSDGICTAKPQDIKYLQQPTENKPATVLPVVWSQTGQNSQDLESAQACVAAFASAYETFNIKQASSLTAATSMLSASAKERFFQGTSTLSKDPRVDAQWLAQAQKNQLQQSAQILDTAALQTVVKSSKAETVSASFIVTYQLVTKSAGKSSTKQQQLLVFLAETSKSASWQVINWESV